MCCPLTDVYCYAENVPTTNNEAFNATAFNNVTLLHVPEASIEAYRTTAPWSEFKDIVALTDSDPKPSGMTTIEFQNPDECRVFDLNGRRLAAPQKGLNIIQTSDGKIKKVMVK